ncbi:putative voltage-gated potassium channel subunit beta [Phytophthora citrophthora]|uniref:Voltage-gated potassium channel subunit beta n=1 Tax=Phytophthora citrophthora TaxID=4793 RepID=A0AAD9LNI9_9STRA|nr:putative voltage-gated potassium channel subunit beta [Phytophthora citrophthora]
MRVESKSNYVSRIPNGGNIPVTPAIGHTNGTGSSSATNAFGKAFDNAGKKWTKALCMADTDGDGQTNGQELGDPCCEFIAGTNAAVRYNTVSHPSDATKTLNPIRRHQPQQPHQQQRHRLRLQAHHRLLDQYFAKLLSKIQCEATGLVLLHDTTIVIFLETTAEQFVAILKQLQQQRLIDANSMKVLANCDDHGVRILQGLGWMTRQRNVSSRRSPEIHQEDRSDASWRHPQLSDDLSNTDQSFLPPNDLILWLLGREELMTIDEDVDFVDNPVAVELQSERVWPVHPLIHYAEQKRSCKLVILEFSYNQVTLPMSTCSRMTYRFLGDSGLLVSKLSLGSWMDVSEKYTADAWYDMMKLVFEHGVNFFNNAEVYGSGLAERNMGAAIKKGIAEGTWSREDLVITTKIFFGPKGFGVNSGIAVANTSSRARKRHSNDWTRTPWISSTAIDKRRSPIEETVRAMNFAINQGWAFYWGTSQWSAAQIIEACEVADRFEMIRPIVEQPIYSILDRNKVEFDYVYLTSWVSLRDHRWRTASSLASTVLVHRRTLVSIIARESLSLRTLTTVNDKTAYNHDSACDDNSTDDHGSPYDDQSARDDRSSGYDATANNHVAAIDFLSPDDACPSKHTSAIYALSFELSTSVGGKKCVKQDWCS